MRRILPSLLLAALTVAALPVLAGEVRYAPAWHEAEWSVGAAPEECRLSQGIPWYGTAAFVRRAGEELQFTLEVSHEAPRETIGRLAVAPPMWMHTGFPRDLGQVALARGAMPVNLGEMSARRILAELEKGMQPTITYRDWVDGRDEVSVALSAVNLRKALGDFYACMGQLLPYPYSAVKESKLHFGMGSADIRPEGRLRLDQLARFLVKDPTVTEVHLTGYSDNQGYRRYNEALSRRRVQAVQDYLVQRGVAEERFTVEVVGETAADPRNLTAAGRAENRRVEVLLKRTPAAPQQAAALTPP